MDKCINESLCCGFSEKVLQQKYSNKENELGPPDYIIIEKANLILFECKDIRINGEIIEKHDYEAIIKEYRTKLYKKLHKNKEKKIG